MAFLDSSFERQGGQPLPEPMDDQDGDEDEAAPVQSEEIEAPQHAEGSPDLAHHDRLLGWISKPNIADELSEDLLNQIGPRVVKEYDIDYKSCNEWRERTTGAVDLAMQVAKKKTYPWPGASNVIYPLMTSAAIQFNARAYPAIIANKSVVKGSVIGDDNGTPMMGPQGPIMGPDGQPQWQVPPAMKASRAQRIGEHMSWQLLDEMEEWEEETDQLLIMLPICGCVFRKTYFDPVEARNFSVVRSPLKVVINYHAKSVETAPRVTEEVMLYPLEVEEAERAGLFLKIDYPSTEGTQDPDDYDAPREFLEQHRYWDLDNDGYAEPYIVTVHKATEKVVRIRARYDADGVHFSGKDHRVNKIDAVQYFTKYDFCPNPEGGVYGVGFGQLLRPINEAVNTSLNQLIDGGHLANTSGGFIGRGLSLNTGAIRFSPGEWKTLNIPGSAIKDNLVPLQFTGPSMVLFQLLQLMIESGREVAAVKDVLTGEQQQHNVPATTTLALIEQGLKVFSAIYKRVYRSLKKEFAKLYRLNRIYLPMEAGYKVGETWRSISQDDYAQGSGVEPISDPSMVSEMQRLAQAQFLQPFRQDPLCNPQEILMRMFDAARIEHPEKLINSNPPPNPAIMAKAMELQIKAEREKAAELKDLAQAILFFAQADAVAGDQHIQWVQQQLEAWKAQFEASADPGGPGGGPGGEGGPAPQPGGPPAPTPDHNAPGPMGPIPATKGIPTGQGPGSPPGSPSPMAGARQAPDGRYYVQDPSRPGKFLMMAQTPESLERRLGG